MTERISSSNEGETNEFITSRDAYFQLCDSVFEGVFPFERDPTEIDWQAKELIEKALVHSELSYEETLRAISDISGVAMLYLRDLIALSGRPEEARTAAVAVYGSYANLYAQSVIERARCLKQPPASLPASDE